MNERLRGALLVSPANGTFGEVAASERVSLVPFFLDGIALDLLEFAEANGRRSRR